jgi:LysM repeat protein
MSGSERELEQRNTTPNVLAFLGVFALTFIVATWSGIAKEFPRVEWRSFQRLWTTYPESWLSRATWWPFLQSWTTTARPPEITNGEKTYTARWGDTLSRIAERHGIALSELVSLNDIEDPNRLHVGQILLIPEAIRSAPEPAPSSSAIDARLEPELLAATGGEDRGAAAVGRFESFQTAMDKLARVLLLEGLLLPIETARVASEPSAETSAALPIEAPAPTANLPASDFRAVDEILAMAEEELQTARFEDALETAETALRLLESDPDSTEARQQRARLELVRANVHIAYGSPSEARHSIERALQADPDLSLDAARTSPKVLSVFRAARRQDR